MEKSGLWGAVSACVFMFTSMVTVQAAPVKHPSLNAL